MRNPTKTAIQISPEDHGRPMSLDDFEYAVGKEGYICELSRGIITVSDVPGRPHCLQVFAIRRQFASYDVTHLGRIHYLAAGSECKILAPDWESERHPDLAVYLTPMPPEEQPWRNWLPEIVIEVVSSRSEERDYVEKREEYLSLAIKEYWIFDPDREEMLVLRRWGKRIVDRTVRSAEIYKTRLLPGFEFDRAKVFEAAAS